MTYLTTKDLAKRWGITQDAVRKRKFKGELPPPDKRFGNSNVWLLETIERAEDELAADPS